jgi:hypothetical protein
MNTMLLVCCLLLALSSITGALFSHEDDERKDVGDRNAKSAVHAWIEQDQQGNAALACVYVPHPSPYSPLLALSFLLCDNTHFDD